MKPLKFDELHVGMKVWDNVLKRYWILDPFSFEFFPSKIEKWCKNNRLYLEKVEDEFTDEEWKELCNEYGIHTINHKMPKPKTREKAIDILEALKKCFDEVQDETN